MAGQPNDEMQAIETAFTFLGDAGERDNPVTFVQFARKYFQDKSASAFKFSSKLLQGPLVKQIWADQDSERMLAVWLSIQRFMGDIPPNTAPKQTNLELVQFICGVGITRPNTRDEIYCQICKQLTDNPTKPSHARGWILLSLCVGCFLPTDAFLPILKFFVSRGPPKYRDFVHSVLLRTEKNGTRKHPPTAVEMMMAFTKEPVKFMLHFYVGSHEVQCDAQSTYRELLAQVAQSELYTREAGFGVYIADQTSDMLTSLSTGYKHVMDVIFEYEALAGAGADWRRLATKRPWIAVLRKECFAPWNEGSANLQLLYNQIMDGMIRGFYYCKKERDLAKLLAQRFYIKHGKVLNDTLLKQHLETQDVAGMEALSITQWVDLVKEEFDKKEYYSGMASEDDVKMEVVHYARSQWRAEFSRRFLRCRVELGSQVFEDAIVSVNAGGVSALSQRATPDTVPISFDFSLFVGITKPEEVQAAGPGIDAVYSFEIEAVSPKGLLTLKVISPEAQSLYTLIHDFYQGLIYRSKFCLATMDHHPPSGGNSTFLNFSRGDLLLLPSCWNDVDEGGWAQATCDRTNEKGDFPTSNVIVLSTLIRPSKETIGWFLENLKEDKDQSLLDVL
eukprot:m.9938 g.9938  ORF g.9938 m.9938 type:complete len:618 (-) comp5507_c0_seq1:462-2315(-)